MSTLQKSHALSWFMEKKALQSLAQIPQDVIVLAKAYLTVKKKHILQHIYLYIRLQICKFSTYFQGL